MTNESDIKNVKITREAHHLLKLESVLTDTSIGEIATAVIVRGLEKKTGARMLAEHQKGMSESSTDSKRAKMPERTKR